MGGADDKDCKMILTTKENLRQESLYTLNIFLSELSKGNVVKSPLDNSTKEEIIWKIFGQKAKNLSLLCLDEKIKECQSFLEMLILWDADLKFRQRVINRIDELEKCVSEIKNL